VKVLKGKISSGSKSSGFRKVLVIIQFSISIALIVSTLIVNEQLHFIRSKKLGYEKENLVLLYLRGETRERYDLMKSELLKNSTITNVSGASAPFIYEGYSTTVNEWEGNSGNQSLLMGFNSVDYDFMETMNIEIVKGRSFTKDFLGDSASALILNETAEKKMGLESPLGKSITIGNRQGRVVGVCKDFHYNTIHHKIEPMALILDKPAVGLMYIRIRSGNIQEAVDHIKTTWNNIEPNHPFTYQFVDQQLDKLYRTEQRVAKLFQYFTFLAILISCLGLFGLTSFMTEQRRKEIGIRKVMGSKISQLVVLLTKEFTRWVIIAGLIGLPAGYILMNKWLQGFHYRIEPGIIFFLIALSAALLVSVLTVSIQTYRASARNPVDTLRDE
jgi:ABC-type antimicrobial peptide transport system permease subunit